jgi:hypothetical protein
MINKFKIFLEQCLLKFELFFFEIIEMKGRERAAIVSLYVNFLTRVLCKYSSLFKSTIQ